MKATKIALISMFAALLPGVANASITITSNAMTAYAYDGTSGGNGANFNGTSIPSSTSLNASDGPSSSQNYIDWTTNGSQTILSWDMEHKRIGQLNSTAETYEGGLYFSSDADTTYDLSGYYVVTDAATSSSGWVGQIVQLYDFTANIYLFANHQDSRSTHDESFTLGGLSGDYSNSLAGSLTGNLLAGHNYQLYFDIRTLAIPDGDAGASALGNLTLKIGEAPAAVPEPLSAIVWGCLVALCAVCCHRN
jgi:hypothetical protein